MWGSLSTSVSLISSAHTFTLRVKHGAGPQKSDTALELLVSTNQTSFSGEKNVFWGKPLFKGLTTDKFVVETGVCQVQPFIST